MLERVEIDNDLERCTSIIGHYAGHVKVKANSKRSLSAGLGEVAIP